MKKKLNKFIRNPWFIGIMTSLLGAIIYDKSTGFKGINFILELLFFRIKMMFDFFSTIYRFPLYFILLLFIFGLILGFFIFWLKSKSCETKENIQDLDDEEKAILREFFLQKKNSLTFHERPSVIRLIELKILDVLGSIDFTSEYVTVSIKKEIKKKINKKPKIIEFYLNPSNEEQKFMQQNSVMFEWSKINHDY